MTGTPPPGRAERVFVGLGANLGDPRHALACAVDALVKLPDTSLVALSSLYRSAPVDADGPDFLNAVAELRSSLPPEQLLDELLAIEAQHGRQRPYRNAPRTLDLDLLMVGEQTIASKRLELPHPRIRDRAFVLVPLAELDSELEIPGQGPVRAMLSRCPQQAIELLAGPQAMALEHDRTAGSEQH